MISLLARIFIQNRNNASSPAVRRAYGILCGVVGICFNVLLFSIKLAAGIISSSIAITADAFNNLSDCASSIISIAGFKISGQRPDSQHPFGHGRMEYISGLIVSITIIAMGMELLISSVKSILNPTEVESSLLVIAILICSIAVKFYMAFYNYKIGKKVNSPAIKATAVDSISDSIGTTAVLLSIPLSEILNYNIDGICGLVVSLMIMYGGYKAIRETMDPLMGQPPSKELVDRIKSIVFEAKEITGIHDLIIHDYGAGRMMLSLHAEVSCHDDFIELHDVVDMVEHRLAGELRCDAVIHMDPVDDDDDLTNELRDKVRVLVDTIDEKITIHDFRIVSGPTHTNLVFDIVVPYSVRLQDKEIREEVGRLVKTLGENYYTVVKIDRAFD